MDKIQDELKKKKVDLTQARNGRKQIKIISQVKNEFRSAQVKIDSNTN